MFKNFDDDETKKGYFEWFELYDECVVEYASDDSDPASDDEAQTRKHRNKDCDFVLPFDCWESSDSDEMCQDELEPEQFTDTSKQEEVKKKSDYMRKHRSEVDEANLEDDEKFGDTIFIDALPNSA